MSEPEQGGATRAGQEITRQIKTANADTNLRANLKEPPPPPSTFDQPGADFGATPTGGAGYQVDFDALATLIGKFEDLLSQSRDQYDHLTKAAESAAPPSGDKPAIKQADATHESLMRAVEHNEAIQQYAQRLINALRRTNGTYRQHDNETAEILKKRPNN